MRKIAYQRPDGGLSICIPVISMDDPVGFTEEMAFQRATAKDIPVDATNVHTVEDRDIPQDRTFRNSWRTNGRVISQDMVVAREMAAERVRQARMPQFLDLDVAYMRAMEVKDDAAAQGVAERKQRLRDAPADPRIQSAGTAEQLKAAMGVVISEMTEAVK